MNRAYKCIECGHKEQSEKDRQGEACKICGGDLKLLAVIPKPTELNKLNTR